MNITFDKTGDAAGKLTVTVSAPDYDAKVTEKLKEIGKKHTIPGFRKGHITLPQLRQRFGRDVMSEAINDTVINGVFDYIKANDIKVLGQPIPAAPIEINPKQTDYTFTYDVAIWPDLNIVLDKSVKLPFYTITVTDEMIAAEDKNLCERFGSQVPGDEVDEKAVIKGSLMQLNEDGSVNEAEGAIQVISAILAPFMLKGKEEADKFMGKKVGDKVVFNPAKAADGNLPELASMLNIDKEIAKDVTSDFEFVISEIIVVKPAEHDQTLYDDVFGKDKVHDEDEYRAALKNMIAMQLMPNSMQLFNRDAADYLVKTYGDMKLDTDLLKRWMVLSDRNTTAEQVEQNFDAMLPGIKWEIISSDVADKLGVKVTEDDMLARAKSIAAQQLRQYGMYNMDDETITDMAKRILADRNISRRIADEVEDYKMFDAIRNAITVENKEVSLDEFKAIAEAPHDKE